VAVLGQLKADMTPKFQKALTRISAQKIPYDQLGLYPDELAEAMNAELEEKWATKGVKITSLAIELNVDEESKQRIAKFQEAKTVGSDPSMLYAMDRMSINKAREAAASNSNGVMAGFMGMGMAGGMMGQPMDATMYQQQMQQLYSQQAAQALHSRQLQQLHQHRLHLRTAGLVLAEQQTQENSVLTADSLSLSQSRQQTVGSVHAAQRTQESSVQTAVRQSLSSQ